MACYMDEEEIWKCPTHPSKRRRTGICPTCLRDRLNTLCPYCAKARPCDCCPAATTSSSSSSSSSSFSFFSGAASSDGEPSMRRSRSLAIPFLRSRSRYAPNLEFTDQKPPASTDQKPPSATGSSRGKTTSSLLSLFKTSKSKKLGEELEREKEEVKKTGNDLAWMKRSRSVSVPMSLKARAVENKSAVRRRGWHFPSPFRQSKSSRVLEEQQSTLCKV